jgi:ribosomal protein S12 methylthiotransferase accessory factor
MIHYVDSDQQDSMQRFSKIFDLRTDVTMPSLDREGLHIAFAKGTNKLINGGSSVKASKAEAIFAALGETLEREAFSLTAPDMRASSFSDLQDKGIRALDPESITVFSDEQEAILSGQATRLNRDSKIDWSCFSVAANGEAIYLPFQFNSFWRGKAPLYYYSTTNGNACGQNSMQAKLAATLELIERDAAMLYWWTQNAPLQIDLSSPDEILQCVCRRFKTILDRVTLFYLPTDLCVGAILAALRTTSGKSNPGYIFGLACKLDPICAIDRALSEVMQISYGKAIDTNPLPDFGDDYDQAIFNFPDHMHLYAQNPPKGALEFLFPARPKTIHFSKIPCLETGDPKKNLALLEQDCKRNGIRLYFKDISPKTAQRAGLFVFRAVSPDLLPIDAIHRFRHLGIPRVYRLPEKLRLKNRPQRFADLNPFPQPIS